jgi:pheromone shutdown-related protein TraB
LIVNLLLVSYQRKIGSQLGVTPGAELLEAVEAARDLEIPVSLCDRNIRITMLRAWRSMSLWQRSKLVSGLVAGIFEESELTEEDLRELRKHDVLSELLNELAGFMPTLKTVLIDERDAYLAQRIRESTGNRVVAVVGAGHVEGICRLLEHAEPVDTAALEVIPAALPVAKILAWGIPIAIVGSLGLLAWTKGPAVAGENAIFWILANGIPSAAGAGIALAHPLTVLTAFVAAPITTLSPLIGAGYVTALVQAWLRPPLVRDFNHLTDEVGRLRMWWRNRLLRVILAFVLPQLGSLVGTYLGIGKIVSSLSG